jgi:hypothetical protein
LLLSFSAEGTLEQVACFTDSGHGLILRSPMDLCWGFYAYLCSP